MRVFPTGSSRLSFPIPLWFIERIYSGSKVSLSLSGHGSFPADYTTGTSALKKKIKKRPVLSAAFVGVLVLSARVSTLEFVGLSCYFDCFFHIIPKINIAVYGTRVFGQSWL